MTATTTHPGDRHRTAAGNWSLELGEMKPTFVPDGQAGEGSVVCYKINFAGGVRELRMQVAEPEPGRTLVQTDTNGSGLVTTFTVTPRGRQALVNITASFDGETGVAGFVERIAAPRRLHRVYAKELAAFDAHARGQRVG